MAWTIDTKLTIWDRMVFESEEQMLDVKAKLESGELKSGIDVSDYIKASAELMLDTQEEMIPDENNGLCTLEIFDNDGNSVWHNGTDEHYFEEN
jgi:hypothetical protein